MNLKTQISSGLWTSVAGAYQAENYSHAILEAVHFMSNLIRERAGIDGDGSQLVGQALGGDLPRLKLNALETESEKNVQKGFEQILRGIYTGIRNPRSHDQVTDSKNIADAIITFIDYICGILSESKEAFTVEAFLERIFDPEFVTSPRYAELIVAEVPKLRMSDAIIGLYNSRQRTELQKFRHLVPRMMKSLNESQLSNYLNLVSEELKTTTEDRAIRTALQVLSPEVWPSIQEIARLRIENKLLTGLRRGEIDESGKTTEPLVTWARDFFKFFSTKIDFANVLSEKLYMTNPKQRKYVAKFFMSILPEVSHPEQWISFVDALIDCVKERDENVRSALISHVRAYPAEWQKDLAAALQEFTDANNPAVVFDDGTPFLSSPSNDGGDEIPF